MESENKYIETDLGNVAPNPRGEYDPAEAYEYLDLVEYGGGSYLCVQEAGTVTGIAPAQGKNTEIWQVLTIPGDLTPEYIAMHDDVVNKAESAQADAASTAADRELVESMMANVEQLQTQTETAAQEASDSRDSAAGYAAAAEASRTAAAESEKNAQLQVTGFDGTVNAAKQEATEEIATARKTAVQAVAAQQVKSVNAVNAAGSAAIEKTSADVREVKDAKAAAVSAANAASASATAAKASEQNAKTSETAAAKSAAAAKTSEQNAKTSEKNAENAAKSAIEEIKTAGNTQIELIKQNGGGIENALSNYFALRRNGKVFTTKIYKYETSSSPAGVKMNANETMVCEPSVGRTKGRDDYEQYGLFQHFTCNFSVDENGFNHVDALEGQIGFTKYGKVQVGEVTMSAWFGIEDTADAALYHYSDSQTELTPRPMKECINPDNTISPFMIHAKYVAGDIDGMPYSSKGLAPANGCSATEAKQPISYSEMIGYMHKLGTHYCGTTSWDLFYRQLMMIIKYATTNSESKMAGCISYNYQEKAVVAETGVSRVVLTKAKAANYIVGSYVSVGEMGENTNSDRYNPHMHNLAYIVKVLKIEDVDENNAAIYVDAPAFDTTLTTCISTMPWRAGSTDEVAGSDGSLGSNTSGKYAYKIQGIETCVGGYEVIGNVVADIVMGSDGNSARDVYVCNDASILTTNIATIKEKYKKAIAQVSYTVGVWKYISKETVDTNLGIMIPTEAEAGSQTGFADVVITDAGTSGQREWLALGNLADGDFAGLWFLRASLDLVFASWFVFSGVSPNGTRGEYQATA